MITLILVKQDFLKFQLIYYHYMQQELKELDQLFESGRYEYNIQFYDRLLKAIHNLNLYQYEESISNNRYIVSKIVELTQTHSDSLNDNYDEQKAIETTKKIHDWINKVDRNEIRRAIEQCHKMNGQSFMHKIKLLMLKGSTHEKEYLEICERVIQNVHTDQQRLQNLFLVAIFMIRNKGKLKDVLPLYSKAIENGLKIIKANLQKINEIIHNQQLLKHPKSIAFIEGNLIMMHTLFDFYTITKALQGRSNVAFKLSSLKQQLQKLALVSDSHELNQFHEILKNFSREIPIKELKRVLCGTKDEQILNKIHHCCNFCLKTGTQKLSYHQSCREILVMLTSTQ